MKRSTLMLLASVIAFSLGSAPVTVADEVKMVVTPLSNIPLADIAGKEASIFLFDVAPGWTIGNHSHPGHIWVYMLTGSINIDVEGQAPNILRPGNVAYEVPGIAMVANNISSTNGATFLVFSIGDIGVPLTAMVEE